MIRCLTFAVLVSFTVSAIADSPNAAPKVSSEAKAIFNGTDLSGWDGDERLWSVKDGVIHGETTTENATKGNTFLIWKDGELKDFELHLSFRCNAVNNSGIQYRSARLTDGKKATNKWVMKGYQHEIRNEDTFPNVPGFIYDEKGTRKRICLVGERAEWNADGKNVLDENLIDAAGFKKLMKVDEWNDVVIVAKGANIKHYLNGQLIMDFTDNHPELALKKGLLGLQLHQGKPMWAEFKEIRLREVN